MTTARRINLAPADIPLELPTRKWKKRNPANLISPDSVLRKLKEKRGPVLVDVREMDDFRRFKIPGSINEALFSVNSGATTTYRGWFYQFQGPICQKKKGGIATLLWFVKTYDLL